MKKKFTPYQMSSAGGGGGGFKRVVLCGNGTDTTPPVAGYESRRPIDDVAARRGARVDERAD